MKRQIAILAAGILMAGVFVLPVSAQEDPGPCSNVATTVSLPTNNSTVGRVFTVQGKIKQTIQGGAEYQNGPIVIFIDDGFYILPERRGNPDKQGEIFPLTRADGSFTVSIDLNGNSVIEQSDGSEKSVSDGKHVLRVSGYGDGCQAAPPAEVTLNVQSAAPAAARVVTQTTQKPLPALTPTPSPSIAPVMASSSPEAKTGGASLNPAVALGLGALLGAAILALAEVSALEYRRKHGGAGIKKK
jgi:hypothetical protein